MRHINKYFVILSFPTLVQHIQSTMWRERALICLNFFEQIVKAASFAPKQENTRAVWKASVNFLSSMPGV